MELDINYYLEQLDAKEDMLARTTNFLVSTQQILEQKNKELRDIQHDIFESVSFANIIQTSLQPDVNILKVFFKDASYKIIQKIGIGGDTIFIKNTNTGVFFGLLDATGHGIPAAVLSVSGLLFLNELSHTLALDNPKTLLELLNYRLFNSFNKNRQSIAHFEGSVFYYCKKRNKLSYSSASGKAIIISKNGLLKQLPTVKQSIGENQQISIENVDLEFEMGDKLMLYSDGLIDQFGGENDRKFMIKKLRELLELNYHKNVHELTDIVLKEHLSWKGTNKQTDDISFKIIEF